MKQLTSACVRSALSTYAATARPVPVPCLAAMIARRTYSSATSLRPTSSAASRGAAREQRRQQSTANPEDIGYNTPQNNSKSGFYWAFMLLGVILGAYVMTNLIPPGLEPWKRIYTDQRKQTFVANPDVESETRRTVADNINNKV